MRNCFWGLLLCLLSTSLLATPTSKDINLEQLSLQRPQKKDSEQLNNISDKNSNSESILALHDKRWGD